MAGGLGAFKQFARAFGVVWPDDAITAAVWAWRELNLWAVQFWKALEYAAWDAVTNPGQTFRAGKICYKYYPSLMNGSLLCTLPDGSVITFPGARIERNEDDRLELTAMHASVKKKAEDKEWPRTKLYGGKLAGIATQGTACLLYTSPSPRDGLLSRMPSSA